MQETEKDPGGDVSELVILERQTAWLWSSSHISQQSLHGPSWFLDVTMRPIQQLSMSDSCL